MKVSVLIPVHNAESTLQQAAASISRQTFCDYEIVFVDDGSSDSSPYILDAISARDDRVRVISISHRGIIDALNAGLAECGGELIARMDADDISHPTRLAEQVAFMDNHPEISLCSSLVRIFPRPGLMGGLLKYEEWLNSLVTPDRIERDFWVESPVAHPSVMLRRSEIMEVGGYREHGWAEDYDLWLRYYAAGKRFAKVEKYLLFWRQSETRLTFTDGRYSVENFLRAKAYYLSRQIEDTDRPIALWGAGKTGRRLCKHLVRNGVPVESIIDIDPRKIGHKMRGIPIYGPDMLSYTPRFFIICAVGSANARRLIREELARRGYGEQRDFICAA